MLDEDPRFIIQYIQDMKNRGVDFIRVKFTRAALDKINIIKSYYRTKSDVKIETDFQQEKIEEELNKLNNEYQKYDYLFDKNLSPQQVFVQYINQQEGNSYWTVDSFTEFMSMLEKI